VLALQLAAEGTMRDTAVSFDTHEVITLLVVVCAPAETVAAAAAAQNRTEKRANEGFMDFLLDELANRSWLMELRR
jgi:hypothetical protein